MRIEMTASKPVINQIEVDRGCKNISIEVRDFGFLNMKAALQEEHWDAERNRQIQKPQDPGVSAVVYHLCAIRAKEQRGASEIY
jgi:hypothetical protein